MPIYEYQCRSCGAVSEIVSTIGGHSDPPQCKKCGSTELDKLLSAPSIRNAGDSSAHETHAGLSCGTKPGSG